MSVKILHFADTHIDSFSSGRPDSETGLPYRAGDFLRSLDEIIDTAIDEKVDIALFAGDAYHSPKPTPTFQREWGKRIKRFSDAHIPLLMICGNHDINPSYMKASALQEVDTWQVPYIHLAKSIRVWNPEELDNAPIRVLTIPWLSPRNLTAVMERQEKHESQETLLHEMESLVTEKVYKALEGTDQSLPLVLLAHYSVDGAKYSAERLVTLGSEVTLSGALVKDPRFTYTALGHLHFHQDLNEGNQPPVVYSGSIEHVNYGEAEEAKGFMIAELTPGNCKAEFRRLHTRPMFRLNFKAETAEDLRRIPEVLPSPEDIRDAMISLTVTYDEAWKGQIDEKELKQLTKDAFEFHLVLRPQRSARVRFGTDDSIASQTPSDIFRLYCDSARIKEKDDLAHLADEIFSEN